MRKLSLIFLMGAFIFILGACDQDLSSDLTTPETELSTLSNDPTPPQIELFIMEEGSIPQHIQTMQLGYNWSFKDDSKQLVTVTTDSPHVLQLTPSNFENATLNLNEGLTWISMQFEANHEPESISAKRWNASYLTGDQEVGAFYEKFEEVEIRDNKIFVESTGNDYVYEIVITWSNGSSIYTFLTHHVNNQD